MKPIPIAVEAAEYFQTTNLNESRVLQLFSSNNTVLLCVDYAGATFDWMDRIKAKSATEASPIRDFRELIFNGVHSIKFVLADGSSPLDGFNLSSISIPGISVIYSTSFLKRESDGEFICSSNKFERLSFCFTSLTVRQVLAKAIRDCNSWRYRSLQNDMDINIDDPFEIARSSSS